MVSPNFTSHICEHLMSPEFTARFRWESDSVAFWDNRATAHLVPTDIPDGFQRTMQRITIAGNTPVGIDGTPSCSLAGGAFA